MGFLLAKGRTCFFCVFCLVSHLAHAKTQQHKPWLLWWGDTQEWSSSREGLGDQVWWCLHVPWHHCKMISIQARSFNELQHVLTLPGPFLQPQIPQLVQSVAYEVPRVVQACSWLHVAVFSINARFSLRLLCQNCCGTSILMMTRSGSVSCATKWVQECQRPRKRKRERERGLCLCPKTVVIEQTKRITHPEGRSEGRGLRYVLERHAKRCPFVYTHRIAIWRFLRARLVWLGLKIRSVCPSVVFGCLMPCNCTCSMQMARPRPAHYCVAVLVHLSGSCLDQWSFYPVVGKDVQESSGGLCSEAMIQGSRLMESMWIRYILQAHKPQKEFKVWAWLTVS